MANQSHGSEDDWDSHWHRYAEATRENPGQRMRQDVIGQLLREDATRGEMRIIDLGSGQGDLLRKLDALMPDAILLGAEMSIKGVAISRAKVPRATFVAADIFQPPAALERYVGWATHAVCSEVLEHVDDPVLFLSSARKFLAPDARLIVTVPAGPMSAFDRHIGHRQHFNRPKIEGILMRAGYSTESVYALGFPFFNLYRLFIVAGGKRLARNVDAASHGLTAALANQLMRLFGFLFRANVKHSRFGWQLVAVAHKTSP